VSADGWLAADRERQAYPAAALRLTRVAASAVPCGESIRPSSRRDWNASEITLNM